MRHEPCRLLRNADGAVKFHRTDARAGTGEKPNRREPLVQTKRRILKDRPGLDGELLLASQAFPQKTGRQIGMPFATALGAHRAIRPSPLRKVACTRRRIGEEPDGFQQRRRLEFSS